MKTEDCLGRPLYEYTASLTRRTDYGLDLDEVLAGEVPIPPNGLRVDLHFEGEVRGELAGRIEGVDYLNVRADGRMELDIRATLTTEGGAKLALAAGGVVLPAEGTPVARLRENVRLSSAHADYAWLNPLEVWAVGEADMEARTVTLRGYLQGTEVRRDDARAQ